eukprot:2683736-Pleurochrysis_carterae.AAC.1
MYLYIDERCISSIMRRPYGGVSLPHHTKAPVVPGAYPILAENQRPACSARVTAGRRRPD